MNKHYYRDDAGSLIFHGAHDPAYYLATQKEIAKRDTASARFKAETGGLTVNGAVIATDRDSQALITGAAVAAMRDSEYSVRWKTAGGFVTLSASAVLDLADAVRAHVQACFDKEREIGFAIDFASDLDALDAIDLTDYP